MFDCTNPECEGTALHCDGSDYRQEWYEEYYTCPDCGHEYTHRVDYKIQSRIVDSDTLTNHNTGEVS